MKRLMLCASLLLVYASSVWAFQPQGGYLVLRGGPGFVDDSRFSSKSLGGEFDVSSGYAVVAGAGLALVPGVNVELEGSWRRNDFDSVRVDALGSWRMDGKISASAVMTNLVLSDASGVFPTGVYAGAGAGAALVEADGSGSDDDLVPAYQVMLGFDVPVNERFSADLQYRFFRTANADLGSLEVEYSAHAVLLGVLVSF